MRFRLLTIACLLLLCATAVHAQPFQEPISAPTPSLACQPGNPDIHAVLNLTANTTIKVPATGSCADAQTIEVTVTQTASFSVAFTASGTGNSYSVKMPYTGGITPTMPTGAGNVATYQIKYDLANLTWFLAGFVQNPAKGAIATDLNLQTGTATCLGSVSMCRVTISGPSVIISSTPPANQAIANHMTVATTNTDNWPVTWDNSIFIFTNIAGGSQSTTGQPWTNGNTTSLFRFDWVQNVVTTFNCTGVNTPWVGCSGAGTASAGLWQNGVDIHASCTGNTQPYVACSGSGTSNPAILANVWMASPTRAQPYNSGAGEYWGAGVGPSAAANFSALNGLPLVEIHAGTWSKICGDNAGPPQGSAYRDYVVDCVETLCNPNDTEIACTEQCTIGVSGLPSSIDPGTGIILNFKFPKPEVFLEPNECKDFAWAVHNNSNSFNTSLNGNATWGQDGCAVNCSGTTQPGYTDYWNRMHTVNGN